MDPHLDSEEKDLDPHLNSGEEDLDPHLDSGLYRWRWGWNVLLLFLSVRPCGVYSMSQLARGPDGVAMETPVLIFIACPGVFLSVMRATLKWK